MIAFDSLKQKQRERKESAQGTAAHQTTKSLFLWSIKAGIRPFGLYLVKDSALCSPAWKSKYLLSYVKPSSSRTIATFLRGNKCLSSDGDTIVQKLETYQPLGPPLWVNRVNCSPLDIVAKG